MYLQRILLPIVAFAVLIAPAVQAQAGQVGGQIGISLTIVKSCQVASETSLDTYRVSSQGCEASAFQLQDERGRPMAAQPSGQDAVTRVESADGAGSRVVVYW